MRESGGTMARILGVDYGERRLGLAVSDPDGIVATVFGVVEVHSQAEAVAAVTRAAQETQAERIVVGFPLEMNGREGDMAAKVRGFVAALTKGVGMPVVTWDERLTTVAVERALLDANISRQKRRRLRDKLAAQAILQSYLDNMAVKQAEG